MTTDTGQLGTEQHPAANVIAEHDTGGLSEAEAVWRLAQYGENAPLC